MIDIYNRLGTDANYKQQLETEDEIEIILAQIKMLLGTSRCDVLGSPYFGLDLKKYLFNLSYNQEEINQIASETILTNIDYDPTKYSIQISVDFGKDYDSTSDYAVINIAINQKKCMGILISQ